MSKAKELDSSSGRARIVITIGGKGGIGKSLCAQIARETLLGEKADKNIVVIDSDVNNSVMAQIYQKVVFVPIRDEARLEARGTLIEALRMLQSGRAHGIVWDLGAGTEDIARARFLPDVTRWAEKIGVDVVAIRPITTSAFSQMQTVEFIHWAAENRIATVIVKNLGQGRSLSLFEHWRKIAEKHQIYPPAVEVDLGDLGAWVSDEATALGLSLADVAKGQFGHLSEGARAVADGRLTPPVQLAIADYLEMQCEAFETAIRRAIDNVGAGRST